MPKTRKVKTYAFDELDTDTQIKILDRFRDINVNYDWWESPIDNKREEIKNEYGVDIGKKIYFDLDRRRYIWFEQIIIENGDKFRDKIIEAIKKDEPNEYLKRQINGENLKQDLTDYFDFRFEKEVDNYTRLSYIETLGIYKECISSRYKILQNINDYFMDIICYPILQDLTDYLHYAYSDEAVSEFIKCNDFQFFENGERFIY